MPNEPRPYKMPLWPLPPLIVIGFTGLALATQETQYLLGEVVLIVVALSCWAGSKKWSPSRTETGSATTEHLTNETSPRLP
jgi:hypothetical protein